MSKNSNHSSVLIPNSALATQNSALLLLIGLPGSGKSTWAKQLLLECPQMQLISTDAIRGLLFGDESIQGSWLLIWQEIQRQLKQATILGKTTIYDATNAQRRHRREIIALARDLGFTEIIGLWVDTPVWLCLARNQKRSRQVPEEIILKMHHQLRDAPPNLEEGLNCLIRVSQLREYGNCSHPVSENPT
jgi:predicted kinase